MKRREFISAIAVGLIGLSIPLSGVKVKESYPHSITYFLRSKWNEYYKLHKRMPKLISVSQALFDRFESELVCCQRFVSAEAMPTERSLAFKNSRLRVEDWLKGTEHIIDGDLYIC